jgi:hypothetical protein
MMFSTKKMAKNHQSGLPKHACKGWTTPLPVPDDVENSMKILEDEIGLA